MEKLFSKSQKNCDCSTINGGNDLHYHSDGEFSDKKSSSFSSFLSSSSSKSIINQKRKSSSTLNHVVRKSFADWREKVRVENLALETDEENDKKTLKKSIGGWILTPDQLKYLKSTVYEYNASAGSILELLIMQKFWTWLAKFIPKTVSPNTITAIGFLINLFTCSIMISYSPDARSDNIPKWALILCAIGVWLYQIADALDGKQCYKVQNSQIEEFYDHGCDSVSTILLMYSTGITLQAGKCPPLFLLTIFTSLFAFYTTHWLNYMTKQMIFGKIDVTEAQWTMILLHLASAIFGQSIWNYKLTISIWNYLNYSIELRTILMLLTICTLSISIIRNSSIILFGLKTPLEKVIGSDKIPRKTNCNRLKPILPALFLSSLIYYCYNNGYYHINPTMFILAFGFNFAKLTMKLVIAHCTNHEIELLDLTLVAPILLTLNDFQIIRKFLNPNIVSHDQALLCALIWDTIELIRYFTFVSWDLRVALDCFIFSIKYEPGHPKNRCQTGGFYWNGLNDDEILKKSKKQEQQPQQQQSN